MESINKQTIKEDANMASILYSMDDTNADINVDSEPESIDMGYITKQQIKRRYNQYLTLGDKLIIDTFIGKIKHYRRLK